MILDHYAKTCAYAVQLCWLFAHITVANTLGAVRCSKPYSSSSGDLMLLRARQLPIHRTTRATSRRHTLPRRITLSAAASTSSSSSMSSTEEEDSSSGKLTMLCLHGFLQSAAVSMCVAVCGDAVAPSDAAAADRSILPRCRCSRPRSAACAKGSSCACILSSRTHPST